MEQQKKSVINQLFGSSPKTTMLSIVGAIVYAIIQVNPQNVKDWKTWIIPVLIIAYGRVSKDSNGITAKEAKAVIKPEEAKAAGTE